MLVNSPSNLLRRSHISFSLILFSSFFCFFFQKFIVFRYFALFHFSFVNPLFYFCFLEIIKIINFYWLLLVYICFFSNTFITVWIFSQRVNLHFVLVGFEHYMKIAFHVKTSLFSSAVNFWVNVRINILENVLVRSKIVLK